MRVWVAMLLAAAVCSAQEMPRTRVEGGTLYPRLIRLEHGAAELRGHLLASTNGVILRSVDDGRTFERVTKVPVTVPGSKERCCATLFEMPATVGALKAGTLLSAASYFEGAAAAIEIYTSTDEGRTWAYLSTPVKRGGEHHGLWEPAFEIAQDGALVMFWSDETDACCSQKLAQMRTYDGMMWKDERDTVRSPSFPERPGMIETSRLANGHYFMSYEVCGPQTKCAVYTRWSPDGWDWGKPENLGVRAVSMTGQYFAHAPGNHVLPDGRVLLVGQMLFERDGTVSQTGNGRVVFVSSSNGRGPWDTMPAPVPVPDAYPNFCPNYSSALLQTADGKSLIELTSDYDEQHKCVAYEGIRPLK